MFESPGRPQRQGRVSPGIVKGTSLRRLLPRLRPRDATNRLTTDRLSVQTKPACSVGVRPGTGSSGAGLLRRATPVRCVYQGSRVRASAAECASRGTPLAATTQLLTMRPVPRAGSPATACRSGGAAGTVPAALDTGLRRDVGPWRPHIRRPTVVAMTTTAGNSHRLGYPSREPAEVVALLVDDGSAASVAAVAVQEAVARQARCGSCRSCPPISTVRHGRWSRRECSGRDCTPCVGTPARPASSRSLPAAP